MHAYVKSWPDYLVLNPDSAVTIPTDFVGIHAHRFPITFPGSSQGVAPAPTYEFGAFRGWDVGGSGAIHPFGWYDLQASSGAAHDFARMDAYLDWYLSRGKTITHCFGLTPVWAAQVAFQTINSQYNTAGGSPPASWSAWEDHVGSVVTHNAGRGKFRYEPWNEPSFSGPGVGGGGTSTAFFWGTAAELVEMAWRGRQIAKAADPTCEWCSPAFTGSLVGGSAQTWLFAQDPTSGKFGHETMDSFVMHPYTAKPTFDLGTGVGGAGEGKIGATKRLLMMLGRPTLPFHVGEVGIGSGLGDSHLTEWASFTPGQRYAGLLRRMLISAARGCKSYMHYSHTPASGLSGDFVNDAQGVVLAMTQMHQLGGQTIPAGGAALLPDGTVTVSFADGSTLTVFDGSSRGLGSDGSVIIRPAVALAALTDGNGETLTDGNGSALAEG